MGRALYPREEKQAQAWVEKQLHRLRHGGKERLLKEFGAIKPPGGQLGEVVRRNQNYFATHAKRLNYQEAAQRGWPIGSGAVESACRSRQCRFKRPGQFWTPSGLRHLCALEEARHNGHWNQLWTSN